MSRANALSGAEIEEKGQRIFETEIQPRLGPETHGQFVSIDVQSGEFTVHPNLLDAVDLLRARRPGAEVWIVRAGYGYTAKFAGGPALSKR
jgi:hypothetical protein